MRKLPPRLVNTDVYPGHGTIISIGHGERWPHGVGVEIERERSKSGPESLNQRHFRCRDHASMVKGGVALMSHIY